MMEKNIDGSEDEGMRRISDEANEGGEIIEDSKIQISKAHRIIFDEANPKKKNRKEMETHKAEGCDDCRWLVRRRGPEDARSS